jgi:hypothetical protein
LDLTRQHVNGDLLKSFAAELAVELLDLELRSKPKRAFELTEGVFILVSALLEVIG